MGFRFDGALSDTVFAVPFVDEDDEFSVSPLSSLHFSSQYSKFCLAKSRTGSIFLNISATKVWKGTMNTEMKPFWFFGVRLARLRSWSPSGFNPLARSLSP